MSNLANNMIGSMANRTANVKFGKSLDNQNKKIRGDASLSALKLSLNAVENSNAMNEIDLAKIVTKPQIRVHFNEQEIDDLAQSIKEVGLVQPIVLSKEKVDGKYTGKYTLICGEKRFRAVQKNGSFKIKAVVVNEEDEKKLVAMQIVENLQRSDPPAVDFGTGISNIIKANSIGVEELSKMLGMKSSMVYYWNTIGEKLTDIEKDTFQDMSANFLTKFINFKKEYFKTGNNLPEKVLAECQKRLAELAALGAEKNTKDARVELIRELFDSAVAKAKKQKAKDAREKLAAEATDNDVESVIGKKISLSWKKIDKKEPDLSLAVNEYCVKHKISLEDAVVEALQELVTR